MIVLMDQSTGSNATQIVLYLVITVIIRGNVIAARSEELLLIISHFDKHPCFVLLSSSRNNVIKPNKRLQNLQSFIANFKFHICGV